MSFDMQPSAGEVSHWARVVPDRLVPRGFPSPISKQFGPAMSIPMAVITNKNLQLQEESKMPVELEVDQNLKKANQKKEIKTKLAKLLAVRKVVKLICALLNITKQLY